MKIAMLATGGIGGYLAVKLAHAGHQVATIARGAHLRAIRANGLALERDCAREVVRPWIATANPAEVGPVDAVIFAVKGDDLEGAAEACRPLLGPDTVVVPFLNGVEAAPRLAAILPEGAVANGVAYVSATISAPGVIGQTGGFGRFLFAERDSRPSARIDALRAAMRAAGIEAPDTDDITREVWKKFVFFSAMSGVTAAARTNMGAVQTIPSLNALYRAVMEETAAVGAAHGVTLPPATVEEAMAFVATLPPQARATTAVDLERGKRLETDWINGAVVRLAEAADLDVPVNRTIYALLAPHIPGK